MEHLYSASSFVIAWALLSLALGLVFALLLWWSVRSGRLEEAKRNRFLALTNCMPEDGSSGVQRTTTGKEAGDDASLQL